MESEKIEFFGGFQMKLDDIKFCVDRVIHPCPTLIKYGVFFEAVTLFVGIATDKLYIVRSNDEILKNHPNINQEYLVIHSIEYKNGIMGQKITLSAGIVLEQTDPTTFKINVGDGGRVIILGLTYGIKML